MVGWEGRIIIFENYKGWDSSDVNRGIIPWLDSDGLTVGQEVKERDDKMVGARLSDAVTYSVEQRKPGGNFQFQPRIDDLLLILMSHFQAVSFQGTVIGSAEVGTGTFSYSYIEKQPSWTGSKWGTLLGGTSPVAYSVYPVSVLRHYGFSVQGSNSLFFRNGIVDVLEITQEYGADLVVNPTFKFLDVDSTHVSEAGVESIGSLFKVSQYTDWKGTLSFTRRGESVNLEISKFAFTSNLGLSEFGKIGKKGFSKFPFQNKVITEVSLDLEFTDSYYLNQLIHFDGSCSLTMRWQNSNKDWMEITMNCLKLRPFEPQLPGGQAVLNYTLPFRAYPDSNGLQAKVSVCKVFGTAFQTQYLGSGVDQQT